MYNPIEFYDTYTHTDSKDVQAKAIVQLLSDNIQHLATKTDLELHQLATKKDIESLKQDFSYMSEKHDLSFKFLDQKIDILRSEMSKSLSFLTKTMFGGFAAIFVCLCYIIFR